MGIDKETREKYVRLKLEEEANDGIREVQNESIFDDESQDNVIEEFVREVVFKLVTLPIPIEINFKLLFLAKVLA